VRDLYVILRKSVLSSAVIMFIIANAGLFAFLITRAGVPEAIGHWLQEVLKSPAMFLLGVNAALFVIGMFIETSAAIIVLAPILAPVAMHFGIDPVHFGLIMVVNLALGMITPPFGVNLFAACTVARSRWTASSAADSLRAGGAGLPDGDHLRAGVSLGLRDLVARVHVQPQRPVVERCRQRRIAHQRFAQHRQPRMARHRHMQRQRGRGLDLVEDQLHHAFVAAAWRVVQRQRHGRDDQLPEQGADVDHAAFAAQVGARAGLDEHRAHLHRAGHADLVFHARRHPDAAAGRHHPAAGRGADDHHARNRVDELAAPVRVRRNEGVAIGVGRQHGNGARGRLAFFGAQVQFVHFSTMLVNS
jgi:hypothetical protein